MRPLKKRNENQSVRHWIFRNLELPFFRWSTLNCAFDTALSFRKLSFILYTLIACTIQSSDSVQPSRRAIYPYFTRRDFGLSATVPEPQHVAPRIASALRLHVASRQPIPFSTSTSSSSYLPCQLSTSSRTSRASVSTHP